MEAVKVFIRTHPVLTYFAVTFAISWGGLLAVGGLDGMSRATWQTDPRLPFFARESDRLLDCLQPFEPLRRRAA